MTITETLTPIRPPIREDEGGALRVGKSRVTVEVVLFAYKNGRKAEEIASDFETVSLADVHAVIAHYLNHREVFDAHLQQLSDEFERCCREQAADPKYIERQARMQARRNALLEQRQ